MCGGESRLPKPDSRLTPQLSVLQGAAAAEPAAAAARGAPLAFSSQPEYGFSPQPPSSRLASSPASSPAALKQAAANYAASPAGFGLRPEPVASTRAPTPPQPPFSGTPEPPAPRAWTPTKQAAGAISEFAPESVDQASALHLLHTTQASCMLDGLL